MQRAVSSGGESGGSGAGAASFSRTVGGKPLAAAAAGAAAGLPSSNSFTAASVSEALAADAASKQRGAGEHAAASFRRAGALASRQSSERLHLTSSGLGAAASSSNNNSAARESAKEDAAALPGPRATPGLMQRQISDDFRKAAKGAEFEPKTSERLERNMGRVHAAMENGSMAAFGKNKQEVLRGIDEIRRRQVDIFRHQMHLEFSLSMDDNEDDGADAEQKIFSSEGFSEEFQEKFKKKERVLDGIHGMLEGLTKQLQDVNAASVVAHMPVDPSYTEPRNAGAETAGETVEGLGNLSGADWNVDFS